MRDSFARFLAILALAMVLLANWFAGHAVADADADANISNLAASINATQAQISTLSNEVHGQ